MRPQINFTMTQSDKNFKKMEREAPIAAAEIKQAERTLETKYDADLERTAKENCTHLSTRASQTSETLTQE